MPTNNIIRSTRPCLDPEKILIHKVEDETLLLSHITFNMPPEIYELFEEYSYDINTLTVNTTGTDSVTVALTDKDELYAKINGYTKTLRFYDYSAISTNINGFHSFGFKTDKEKYIDKNGYYVGLVTTLKENGTKMGSLPKFNGKVGLLESIGLINDIFKNSDTGYLSFNTGDNTRKFELAPVINNTLNRNYIISGKNFGEVQYRKSKTLAWFRSTWDINILDSENYIVSDINSVENYQNNFINKTHPKKFLKAGVKSSEYIDSRPFYFVKCSDSSINDINITIIARCFPVNMEKRKLAPGMWIFSYPEWVMNKEEIVESIQPKAYLDCRNGATVTSIYETDRTTFGLDDDEGTTPKFSDYTNRYNLMANCNLVKVGGQ